MAIWSAGIAAAASIGGGLLGGSKSAREAAKQRKFIKKMYRNRYQWQMEDMRDAGLNPILSAYSAPPTASAGGIADTSAYADIGKGVGQAAAQYFALQNVQAQTRATNAQAAAQEAKNPYEESTAIAANTAAHAKAEQEVMKMDAERRGIYDSIKDPQEKAEYAKLYGMGQPTASLRNLQEGTSAKSQQISESQAREILTRAGIPVAQFEGMGGKYLIDLARIILQKKGR